MALINCPDCNTEVSDQAAACPRCARPIRPQAPYAPPPSPAPTLPQHLVIEQKQRTSPLTWGCLIFFILFAIGLIISESSGGGQSSYSPERPQKTEAEKKFDANVALAAIGNTALKKAMRDPDSYRIEKAVVLDSGAVCYEYRAKNGFGGYTDGQAVLAPDAKAFKMSEQDGFNRLWKKHCANKTGTDVSARFR